MELLSRLQAIKQRFDEVSDLIIQPNILSDKKRYAALNKEYKELGQIVDKYKVYKGAYENLIESENIINQENDADLIALARLELQEAKEQLPILEQQIKYLLIPKDPEDDKSAILELRAGTGGDEACIFVEDVLRMYTLYFKQRGWKHEVVNANSGSVKGFKEVILNIQGAGVYGELKFESGVHRVQRVPETESQGRVHTSAITVAVLPEAEAVDVNINPVDIKRDTFRSSGAGGQHVNKTESAIRLTHMPTGVVVECQEERSQHKNFEKAMTVLRSRIYQMELEKKEKERALERKSLVSTGDRSAKIRTYNYPQGRVTDHRINKTLYNLASFMNGDLSEMIESLKIAENAEKLKGADLD